MIGLDGSVGAVAWGQEATVRAVVRRSGKRGVMSAGWANALQLLYGGDRPPEERTTPAAASAGADVRLARDEGGAPFRVAPLRHGLANQDLKSTAGGLDAAASSAVALHFQRPAAREAYDLLSRPDAWGAQGVRDPDLVMGAWLYDLYHVGDACRVDMPQ